MHGFYRLNILRGFTICTLFLVVATACLVITTNFRDTDFKGTFFSSINHLILIIVTGIILVSEIDLFRDWFGRYFPLLGPESALITLGILQIVMTSYVLSDRHCVVTDKSPAYLDKLLLATGIISGCSGLFNITASSLFRGSKPGKMRLIRRYGTPVPDTEKGYTPSIGSRYEEEPTSMIGTFKNAFKKAGKEEERPPMNISGPYPS